MSNLTNDLEEMQTQTLTIQASGIHATAAKWLLLEASTDFAAKAELPGRGELWERTQAARKQAEWYAKGQGVTLRDLLRSHGLLATADRLAPSPETDLTGLSSAQDVHNKLQNDRAYTWSRENNDCHNMMIALRAHGFNHTIGHAKHMIDFIPEVA